MAGRDKGKGKGKGRGGGGRRTDAGPKYPVRLLKELGESLDLNDRKRRKRNRKTAEPDRELAANDVYEYEEGVPQEESGKNKRFDSVDNFEYELPSDFEDEEIDEDAAFGDDEKMEGDMDEENEGSMDEEDEETMDEEDEGIMDEEGDTMEPEQQVESDEDEEASDIDEEAHGRMVEELTGRSRKRGREDEDDDGFAEADAMQASISVEDLLAPLDKQPGMNALKKRMRVFQKQAAPTSTPAPRALQEKLDRKAAYEKTSKDITKWQPLIKHNREAPTLNFVKKPHVSFQTTGEMVANFVPTTQLEKEVDALLKEYGVDDPHKITAAEELELNKLSVEEAKKRRDKLAQMRSLLFRHEVKAKRLKKIKSKAFRRGERKAHQKSNPDMLIDDPELQKEAAMKQETNRAIERMTLKHKNTSRWAKRILKRGAQQFDEGTREAINEQLRKHALLTQKINSAHAQSSSDEENDSEDESEPEGLVLGSKKQGGSAMAKAKVAMLKALEDGDNEAEMPKTGIFALPFMARAIERKRKETENEAKALLEELEQAEEDENTGTKNVPLVTGRRSFGGSQKQQAPKGDGEEQDVYERGSDSEFSEDERPEPSKPKVDVKKASRKSQHEESEIAKIQLDGLRVHAPHEEAVKQEGPISIGETPSKSSSKMTKKSQKRKHVESSSVIAANPTIFTPVDNLPVASHSNKKAKKTQAKESEIEKDDKVDSAVEAEEAEALVPRSQEDLIREAFAGDDVEAEFEEMKRKAVEEECPTEKNEEVNLPGWGQWTAVQQKHGPPKWLVQQQEELQKKKEAAKKRREDAKLKCFIVSEKTDKKAGKYYAASLPFPFTSKETYENSIRMPIGAEYNTYQSFRDFTRPDVIKRAGTIIDPIEYEKPKANDGKKNNKTQKKTSHTAKK